MATSWRSRVVAARPSARASSRSASGANSDAATRIAGSSLSRDASTIAATAEALPHDELVEQMFMRRDHPERR